MGGRIVDLFAGPGGWSQGVAYLGLADIGLELDADACRTRVAAGHRTVRCDVATYPPEAFRGFDGLVASPPCQAFSMAGKRLGMLDLKRIHAAVEACRGGWVAPSCEWADDRSPLILEPLRWAWTIRPTWIACEQVPPARGVWEHMADVLREWGYDARALKLNSADYGVPQTRERAFLLAHRERVHVAEPTHAEKPEAELFAARLPWVSMANALGWMEGSRSLDRRYGGYAADAAPLADAAPSPTLSLSKGREVWRLRAGTNDHDVEREDSEPAPTLRSGNRLNAVSWVRTSFGEPKVDGRNGTHVLDPNESPSHAVTGKVGSWALIRPATSVQGDPRVGRPGHKDREGGESQFANDSLRIELHEAATLQGFPPDYPFRGTKTSQFRQCGNAVPPTWAAQIIGALSGSPLLPSETAPGTGL